MGKSYLLAVVAAACLGADAAWRNTGIGSWDTPANWDGDVLPGAGDAVVNDVGGTIMVDGMFVTANSATALRDLTQSGPNNEMYLAQYQALAQKLEHHSVYLTLHPDHPAADVCGKVGQTLHRLGQ